MCEKLAALGISSRSPFWRKFDRGLAFGVFPLTDKNDTFFFEALEGIFESFLVHRLKVRQITLMIQSLSQLQNSKSQSCEQTRAWLTLPAEPDPALVSCHAKHLHVGFWVELASSARQRRASLLR